MQAESGFRLGHKPVAYHDLGLSSLLLLDGSQVFFALSGGAFDLHDIGCGDNQSVRFCVVLFVLLSVLFVVEIPRLVANDENQTLLACRKHIHMCL